MSEKKVFDVHIEQGHAHNQKIVLRGEAGQGSDPTTLPGDVVFVLEMRPHATFKRVHHDLIMEKVCSLLDSNVNALPEERDPTTLPGDVVFVLEMRPHATFKRVHHDLIMEKVSYCCWTVMSTQRPCSRTEIPPTFLEMRSSCWRCGRKPPSSASTSTSLWRRYTGPGRRNKHLEVAEHDNEGPKGACLRQACSMISSTLCAVAASRLHDVPFCRLLAGFQGKLALSDCT